MTILVTERLKRLFGAMVPPVTTSLCRVMQPTLYRYVWKVSASQQVRVAILTVILFPLSIAPLELQRLTIDVAIKESDVGLLVTFGGVYLLVVVLHSIVKYGVSVFGERIGEGVVRLLRRRVAGIGAAQPRRLGEGTRVAILSAESERIGGFAGEAITVPLMQGGIMLSVFAYMLYLEPLIAAVAALFVGPSVALFPKIQARIDDYLAARTRLIRDLGEAVSEGGVGSESTDGDEARNGIVERIYNTRIRIILLKHLQKRIFGLLGGLGPGCILIVGGWLVIEGRIEIGVVVAFLSGFERILDPARELLNFYRRISQTRVQYQLIRRAMT